MESVVDAYLVDVDAGAPGLVEGLHLVGSVAMGDFQVGGRLTRLGPSGASSSDIDFVAVTNGSLGAADLAAWDASTGGWRAATPGRSSMVCT